jgi:hypothetical protein
MRGGARGQLAIFVLVGLGLLLIFIILLVIRNSLSKNANDNQPETRQVQLARQYVDGCIDSVSEEAFKTLGRQGGLILKSQNGLVPNDNSLMAQTNATDGTWRNVSYGLINDSGSKLRPLFPHEFIAQYAIPAWTFDPRAEYPYPWPSIPYEEIYNPPDYLLKDYLIDKADGPFGQYALPPLCDVLGPNHASAATVSCELYLYNNPTDVRQSVHLSIQQSLAAAITSGLVNCIQEEELGKLLGADMPVREPNVSVIFTMSETLVDVRYEPPLSAATPGGALALNGFSRRYPLRLLPIFRYSFQLLKRASKDPSFLLDAPTSYTGIPGYDGYIVSATRLSNSIPVNSFLVSVLDPASLVDGESFVLQFLVQNRRPVLGIVLPGDANNGNLRVCSYDPDGDKAQVAAYQIATSPIGNFTFLGGDRPTCGTITGAPTSGRVNVTAVDFGGSGLPDWQVVQLP